MRKIAMIGSTQYIDKFRDLYKKLMKEDDNVQIRIPAFDDIPGDEFDICEYNRQMIDWADEVYLIWDGRSMGAVFDLGMCFALQKKLIIEYLEPKSFVNFVKFYAKRYETEVS